MSTRSFVDGCWRLAGRPACRVPTLMSALLLFFAASIAQADTIFSDDFNRTTSNTVGNGWTEDEDDSDDVAIVTGGVTGNAMQLRDNQFSGPDAAAAHLNTSTFGFESLNITFDWAALTDSEGDDYLYIDISANGGSTWSNLAFFGLGGDGSFTNYSSNIGPAYADNSNFAIRFRTNVSQSNEGALIDNVLLEGTPIVRCTIFEDDFNRSVSNTVGNGWTEDEDDSDDVAIVSGGNPDNAMQLRDNQIGVDALAAQIPVSTVGYADVIVSFEYKPLAPSESSDDLYLCYTTNNGGSFSCTSSYGLGGSTWSGSIVVPTSASADNNASFGILFVTNVNNSDEGALIDNVSVQGTGACGAPPDNTPPSTTNVNVDDVEYDGDATVTATITDTESNIDHANYDLDYLDDSPGSCDACNNPTAMDASDGTFDEMEEDVTATTTGDLFVGSYNACVTGYDTAGNSATACDGFDVTQAQLSIMYNGEYLDLNGMPTTLKATVSGPDPCANGAQVEFFYGDDPTYTSLGTANTNGSGVATITTAIPYGVWDVKVEVDDQDVGGTAEAECLGATDTDMVVVADPNASSTGGGFYMLNDNPSYSDGNPRAHFGYTAQRKYDKDLEDYVTIGNLLWMHKTHWRLKGKITEGGKLPDEACPYDPLDVYPTDYEDYTTDTLTCAAFGGEGTLYEFNEYYSPYCPIYICGPEWINPHEVGFTFMAYDGGSAKDCKGKGKKCKDVDRPDAFGLLEVLDSVDIGDSGGPFVIELKGGNLVVRGSD